MIRMEMPQQTTYEDDPLQTSHQKCKYTDKDSTCEYNESEQYKLLPDTCTTNALMMYNGMAVQCVKIMKQNSVKIREK